MKTQVEDTAQTISIDELVNSYCQMWSKNKVIYEKLIQRLKNNTDAVRGEAAVYCLLNQLGFQSEIEENSSYGGIDFCSQKKGNQIFVEVTSLSNDSIETKSGILNNVFEQKGGGFSFITKKLIGEVKDKVTQLAARSGQRILFITSSHSASHFLLGERAVEFLLISEPQISWMANVPNSLSETVSMEHPVFFHITEEGFKPRFQTVSAIILLSLYEDRMYPKGIIHPEPTIKLDAELFANIPFVRMLNWPPIENTLSVEWINSNDSATYFYLPLN